MKTEQQKKNIETHIKFLRDNADEIRHRFDMRWVFGDNGCKCAFGFVSESLGVDIDRNVISSKDLELFGFDALESTYCFAGNWYTINNTPEAAAARMEACLYDQAPTSPYFELTNENAHPIVNVPQPEKVIKKNNFKNVLTKIQAMIL